MSNARGKAAPDEQGVAPPENAAKTAEVEANVSDREKRLAQALRANLKRRKLAARKDRT